MIHWYKCRFGLFVLYKPLSSLILSVTPLSSPHFSVLLRLSSTNYHDQTSFFLSSFFLSRCFSIFLQSSSIYSCSHSYFLLSHFSPDTSLPFSILFLFHPFICRFCIFGLSFPSSPLWHSVISSSGLDNTVSVSCFKNCHYDRRNLPPHQVLQYIENYRDRLEGRCSAARRLASDIKEMFDAWTIVPKVTGSNDSGTGVDVGLLTPYSIF